MAAQETPETVCKYGYQCPFKDAIINDLLKCSSCDKVARELSIISCCGEHFCQPYIKYLRERNKNCPKCDGREFIDTPSKKIQNEISKLTVFCSLKDRGCDWEGQVRDFDEHEGKCEHAIVQCPKDCGLNQIKRGKLAEHLESECPKREYSCPHCNFKDTYSFVMNAHMPQCSFFPVKCPNQCGVVGERDDMETHTRDVCPKQYIKCSLSFAGCKDKFRREDKEQHMDENWRHHFELLATKTEGMSEEIRKLTNKNTDEKELETDSEMGKVVEEMGQKVEEMGTKVGELITKQLSQTEQSGEEMTILRDKIAQERGRVDDLEKQVNNLKINEDISPPEQQPENMEMEKKRLEMELKMKEAKIQQLHNSLEEHKKAIEDLKKMFEEHKKAHDLEFERYKRESNDRNLELEKRLAKLELCVNNAHPDNYMPPPQAQANPPNLPTFTMDNFSEHMARNERWSSPSFTAHEGGPTLVLEVWPNGQQEGQETHVSVWFVIESRDHEIFEHITIGLKLLSNDSSPDISQAQTFKNTNNRYIGAFNEFLARTDLDSYLKDERLRFQITNAHHF